MSKSKMKIVEVDYEAINQMAADARNEAKYTKSLHAADSEVKGPNKKMMNRIKAAEGKQIKKQKADAKRVNQKRKAGGGFDHDLGSDSESDENVADDAAKKRSKKQQPVTIDPEEAKRTLFVHNLPHDTVVGDVKDLFPGIQNVSLQKRGAKCRGSAFVTMDTVENAALVVKNQSGYQVLGKPIAIEFKKITPTDDQPTAYTATTWVKEGGASDPRTLFIKKLPLGVSISAVKDILESEGGPVDGIHFTANKRSIIVQFATEEGSRKALLTKTFVVRGEEISLQPSSVSYESWLGQKSSKQTTKSWKKKSPSKCSPPTAPTPAAAEGTDSAPKSSDGGEPKEKEDKEKPVEETTPPKDTTTTTTTSSSPAAAATPAEEPKTESPAKPKPAKKVSVFSFKPRAVRK